MESMQLLVCCGAARSSKIDVQLMGQNHADLVLSCLANLSIYAFSLLVERKRCVPYSPFLPQLGKADHHQGGGCGPESLLHYVSCTLCLQAHCSHFQALTLPCFAVMGGPTLPEGPLGPTPCVCMCV